MQIEESLALDLEGEHMDFPRTGFYSYNLNETLYREYHVDSHVSLSQYICDSSVVYGGNLSVRKNDNDRPIMLIGQDESTYNQYAF